MTFFSILLARLFFFSKFVLTDWLDVSFLEYGPDNFPVKVNDNRDVLNDWHYWKIFLCKYCLLYMYCNLTLQLL